MAQTDLHPGIKGVHQCKGVSLVAVQGLASGGAVRVVLSAAQKRRLDTQSSGNRQHWLHQFEDGAQNQHFSWTNTRRSIYNAINIVASSTNCTKQQQGFLTNDHIHRQLSQQPANGGELPVFI